MYSYKICLGSSTDPGYIQNRDITNRVIKRLRCMHAKLLNKRSYTEECYHDPGILDK